MATPLKIDSLQDLNNLLSVFPQINTNTWIKDVEALYQEIKSKECVLEIGTDGSLLRRVSVVMIKCFYTDNTGNLFQLVEEKQVFTNGKIRERKLQYVSEKLQACETLEQSALRALAEELQISDPDMSLTELPAENTHEIKESSSYTGILSSYKKFIFSCYIPHKHYHEHYAEVQKDKKTFFKWVKL